MLRYEVPPFDGLSFVFVRGLSHPECYTGTENGLIIGMCSFFAENLLQPLN